MYAIFKNGGKQYKVVEGSIVLLDKMSLEPKSKVELNEVLAIVSDDKAQIGDPFVKGAKIEAEVINEGAEEKTVRQKEVLDAILLV